MKNLLTTLIGIAAIATTSASGLYFVSGGDFRPCRIKYVLRTTNDNQQVELSPYRVKTLSIYQSNISKWGGTWSLKTEGTEHEFSMIDNIRQNTVDGDEVAGSVVLDGSGNPSASGATNITPYVHTFAKAGNHLVKLYDLKSNIYNITFNNPDMVSLYLDWSDIPSKESYTGVKASLQTSPNLESLYWNPPMYDEGISLTGFKNLPLLKNLTLVHPERYVKIDGEAFYSSTNLIADLVFQNVTNVGQGAFQGCYSLKSVRLPNIVSIGSVAFNGAYSTSDMTLIGIGDRLASVGQCAFLKCEKVKTIEFTTDPTNDWISVWNNHPILPGWLGTATAIEGEPDQATITPTPINQSGNTNWWTWTTKNGPQYRKDIIRATKIIHLTR